MAVLSVSERAPRDRDMAESCPARMGKSPGCHLPSLAVKPSWCCVWVTQRHTHSLPYLEGQEQLKSPSFVLLKVGY